MSHRCIQPNCRKLTNGREALCQLHGGTPYIPKRDRRAETLCPDPVRFAIEDMIVHMARCPQCAQMPFTSAVWLWENTTRAAVFANACANGRHIVQRLDDALRDTPYGLPGEPLRMSMSEARTVAELILHIKTCPTCRDIRPLDRPVWEWDEHDKAQFEELACPAGVDRMTHWEYHRSKRLAA